MSQICADCRAVLRDRGARLRHARLRHRIVDLRDAWARASLRAETPVLGPIGQEAGRGVHGIVAGVEELKAPVSGRPCVAFGIRLLLRENRTAPRVVLQEQLTSGFRVQTASGEIVIDRGTLVLNRPWTQLEPRHLSNDLVRYLVGIDPLRANPETDQDPFLWNSAEEIVIGVGDRVSLLSGTQLREEHEAGLRAPARMVAVAEEEPTIELVSTSSAPEKGT